MQPHAHPLCRRTVPSSCVPVRCAPRAAAATDAHAVQDQLALLHVRVYHAADGAEGDGTIRDAVSLEQAQILSHAIVLHGLAGAGEGAMAMDRNRAFDDRFLDPSAEWDRLCRHLPLVAPLLGDDDTQAVANVLAVARGDLATWALRCAELIEQTSLVAACALSIAHEMCAVLGFALPAAASPQRTSEAVADAIGSATNTAGPLLPDLEQHTLARLARLAGWLPLNRVPEPLAECCATVLLAAAMHRSRAPFAARPCCELLAQLAVCRPAVVGRQLLALGGDRIITGLLEEPDPADQTVQAALWTVVAQLAGRADAAADASALCCRAVGDAVAGAVADRSGRLKRELALAGFVLRTVLRTAPQHSLSAAQVCLVNQLQTAAVSAVAQLPPNGLAVSPNAALWIDLVSALLALTTHCPGSPPLSASSPVLAPTLLQHAGHAWTTATRHLSGSRAVEPDTLDATASALRLVRVVCDMFAADHRHRLPFGHFVRCTAMLWNLLGRVSPTLSATVAPGVPSDTASLEETDDPAETDAVARDGRLRNLLAGAVRAVMRCSTRIQFELVVRSLLAEMATTPASPVAAPTTGTATGTVPLPVQLVRALAAADMLRIMMSARRPAHRRAVIRVHLVPLMVSLGILMRAVLRGVPPVAVADALVPLLDALRRTASLDSVLSLSARDVAAYLGALAAVPVGGLCEQAPLAAVVRLCASVGACLAVLLRHHSDAAGGAVASLQHSLFQLLDAVFVVSRRESRPGEAPCDAAAGHCADTIARLLEEAALHPQLFGKTALHLFAEYARLASLHALSLPARRRLVSGLYALLDVCDAYVVATLMATLPPAMRDAFDRLRGDHERFHRYHGRF